ncbi:MAG: hypothetical protein RBU25_07140 [Lentisphaeria bacterium]|jgi:hypothetical protein|nr:hypothetical protein [Lentisphaeria bacterium]
MASFDEWLTQILDGHANVRRENGLTLANHQSRLVRWVREFLLFAQGHGGYTFEETLDLFLAEVGGRPGTKPWQLQEAADAIRAYRLETRAAGAPKAADAKAFLTHLAMIGKVSAATL